MSSVAAGVASRALTPTGVHCGAPLGQNRVPGTSAPQLGQAAGAECCRRSLTAAKHHGQVPFRKYDTPGLGRNCSGVAIEGGLCVVPGRCCPAEAGRATLMPRVCASEELRIDRKHLDEALSSPRPRSRRSEWDLGVGAWLTTVCGTN